MNPKVVEVPGMGNVEFPGDMSDDAISAAIKANMGQKTAPAPPTATIGSDEPQGVQEGIVHYLRQLEGDVKYGTGQTFAGKLLKIMGAQGTDVGAQANMSQSLKPSSPLTGSLKAVQGTASGDVKQTLSGIGEAATLPSMVMGGASTPGVLGTIRGVEPTAKGAIEAIPSAGYAGKVIGEIEQAHGMLPVNPQQAERVAQAAKRLKELGGYQLPSPIKAFLKRIEEPNALNVQDAREIYSSATSRLSPLEWMKMRPKMSRQLAMFADRLNGAIADALAPVGQSERYLDAVAEYHQGKRLQQVAAGVGATAVGAAKLGAADKYIRNVLGR